MWGMGECRTCGSTVGHGGVQGMGGVGECGPSEALLALCVRARVGCVRARVLAVCARVCVGCVCARVLAVRACVCLRVAPKRQLRAP